MTTYSLDLRQRAMAAYKETGLKAPVCKTFRIARTTLDAWIKLEEETGLLQPRQHRIRGHSHTITDWDDFKVFVQTTPFNTVYDLIEPFQLRYSKSISYDVLLKGLKRIGWSNKKRAFYTNKPAT